MRHFEARSNKLVKYNRVAVVDGQIEIADKCVGSVQWQRGFKPR